jgi:hypothetical protein
MAQFDVLMKKKIIVSKVTTPQESKIEGAIYLATITSSTKAMALKQANANFESGIIKLPKIEPIQDVLKREKEKSEKEFKKITKPSIESKVIYCDFNGVLDDRELDDKVPRNQSDAFRLPNITCPHKVIRLLKLAIKHNAKIVTISEHRKYGFSTYDCIFIRCLLNCGIQEYIDFFNDNEDIIDELIATSSTKVLNNRSDEVRTHIKEYKHSHYVVFEDSHPIDSDLNLIEVDWAIGLLDKHIEEADLILSKPF